MKSPDPASLDNLNDVLLPPDISWWPLAAGWYVLGGLLLCGLIWWGIHWYRNWKTNTYRRSALQALDQLELDLKNTEEREAGLRQIPALLKRTALSAFPRKQVASLTGADWIGFLNSCTRTPLFAEPEARTLQELSYTRGSLDAIDRSRTEALVITCRLWIRQHKAASLIATNAVDD